ncbi:MAG: inositol monophosphatase family protein [Candidatus Altiarchaeota archaeon]
MLATAEKAALDGGRVLQDNFGRIRRATHKQKKDLVTEADILSEKKILSIIRKGYPHHNILSEESTPIDEDSEYTWVVDPLDGTHNFYYGMPFWGVSVALFRREKPQLGVIYLPNEGELYHAVRGKGAYCNGKKLKVSGRTMDDAMLMFGVRFFQDSSTFSTFRKLVTRTFSVRMLSVAVTSFAYVVQGKADAYVAQSLKPWDYAAGCLLVEEAGGKSTDFGGREWKLDSGSIVCSNGRIHKQLLEVIR